MRDFRYYLGNLPGAASSPAKKLFKTSVHFVLPMNPTQATVPGDGSGREVNFSRHRIAGGADHPPSADGGGVNHSGKRGGVINLPNVKVLNPKMTSRTFQREIAGPDLGQQSCPTCSAYPQKLAEKVGPCDTQGN